MLTFIYKMSFIMWTRMMAKSAKMMIKNDITSATKPISSLSLIKWKLVEIQRFLHLMNWIQCIMHKIINVTASIPHQCFWYIPFSGNLCKYTGQPMMVSIHFTAIYSAKYNKKATQTIKKDEQKTQSKCEFKFNFMFASLNAQIAMKTNVVNIQD